MDWWPSIGVVVVLFGILATLVIVARRERQKRSEHLSLSAFLAKLPPGGNATFHGREPEWLLDALRDGVLVRGPDGKSVMRPRSEG
jgi:hypothetical protein